MGRRGFGANQVVDLLLRGVQAAHGRRDLGGQGVHLEVLSVPPGDIGRGFWETRESDIKEGIKFVMVIMISIRNTIFVELGICVN